MPRGSPFKRLCRSWCSHSTRRAAKNCNRPEMGRRECLGRGKVESKTPRSRASAKLSVLVASGGAPGAAYGSARGAGMRDGMSADDIGEQDVRGPQRGAASGLVSIALRRCSRQRVGLPPAFPGLSPLTRRESSRSKQAREHRAANGKRQTRGEPDRTS
jgi:hypothetical protein